MGFMATRFGVLSLFLLLTSNAVFSHAKAILQEEEASTVTADSFLRRRFHSGKFSKLAIFAPN